VLGVGDWDNPPLTPNTQHPTPNMEVYEVTNVKNELPIAVHVASGGDARVKTGGTVVELDGITGGSFQVTNGTRYRLFPNLRANITALVLVGYSNPLTLENGSRIATDLNETVDDVPAGTTVYFAVLSAMDLSPLECSEYDFLYVTYYG